ncbi:MAG TPA: phenylalanine--tRNA ligase subunit alpha, partial [Opitutales bacterium]|nr:phenylalanine--tRNA ligase subunit alpha [Opitutales bacterium]
MSADLSALLTEAQAQAVTLTVRPAFEAFKAQLVGPQGMLTEHMKSMGKLPAQERPEMGKKINEAKRALETLFSETLARIEAVEARGLLGEPVDPTLPAVAGQRGSRHPLAQVREQMLGIFRRIGFYVAEGFEAESDWACCDALNIPPEHPARAEHDTYYLRPGVAFKQVGRHPGDKVLMRTQTSTVQIRTMLAQEPPIRIVATGRCFRRDAADATHSANFHQMEGLCVDKHI